MRDDQTLDVSALDLCITHCRACQNICLRTLKHCLNLGGKHAQASHIILLMDCIDICGASAAFMLRDSSLHGVTCRACADICEACAGACEAMSEGDVQMQACVKACRDCTSTCREMARSMGELTEEMERSEALP